MWPPAMTHIARTLRAVSGALILLAASGVTTPAAAQSTERQTTLQAGAGIVTFDLSGTGNTAGFAGRVAHELTRSFVVEGGVLVARPEQQFGDSTIVVPEAQLQFQFRLGSVLPYVGAGIGAMRESSDVLATDWSPVFSGAVGVRIPVQDRVGLFADFRLRGIEWRAVGTTAEAIGGVTIGLGR